MQKTLSASSAFSVWPAVASLGGALVFMLAASVLYWPTPVVAFASDASPVSWLSSAQLWSIALLSLRTSVDRTLPLAMAIWLFVALVLLACDEQFMLHEQWKYGCAAWWGVCRQTWATELPMLAILVFGLATAFRLHGLLVARMARTLLWTSLGIGMLALCVDLLAWPAVWVNYEEALEVLAEAVFIGMLLGLKPA